MNSERTKEEDERRKMINFALKYGSIVAKLPQEDIEETIQKVTQIVCKKYALIKANELVKNNNHFTDYISSRFNEWETERHNYWIPVFRKLKVPYIIGYNLLPDFNGDLYMCIDLTDFIEISSQYKKGAIKMKNIKDNKPVDGTIIGELTEEEIQSVIDHQVKEASLDSTTLQCSSIDELDRFLAKVESIQRLKYDVWLPIHKRFNASWEWDLRCDYATGNVYVVNYDNEDDE